MNAYSSLKDKFTKSHIKLANVKYNYKTTWQIYRSENIEIHPNDFED